MHPDRGLRAIFIEDPAVDQVRRAELVLVELGRLDLAVLDECRDLPGIEQVTGAEEHRIQRDQRGHVDRLAEAHDRASERRDVLVADHDAEMIDADLTRELQIEYVATGTGLPARAWTT